MTNEFILHKDDLETIKQFMDKYPKTDTVCINIDSSSGIGSIIKASVMCNINGDDVTVTKLIADESSW
jgi:hypothetical protein